MSGGSIVEHIDAVDAFARTLYVRAKQSPSPSLATDVALAVRQLHLALRHLRVEAADPDSLLNTSEPTVYPAQLNPIVRDAEVSLKQLETVLDYYGASSNDFVPGMTDHVAAVRSKLTRDKTAIETFLDLVQLDSTATISPARVIDDNQPGLEVIKDQVDGIARRLFAHRENSMTSDDGEHGGRWQEFKAELEKEGFSSKVLDEHKVILRAYIRELESMSTMNGGAPPTVRGLLECEARSTPAACPSGIDNGSCSPNMNLGRFSPDCAPVSALGSQLTHQRRSMSSDENDSEMSDSMALVSTKDLMVMDTLNASMASLYLQSPGHSQDMPPPPQAEHRFLTSAMSGALPPPADAELSRSASSQLEAPHPVAHLRPSHSTIDDQHIYGSSAPSAYGAGPPMPRLAPDSYGREIPMDAQWTKIKRTLVSPEVLHRAGVRYEARPDYVAVLGRLSRDQIAHFARLSAECRAARGAQPPPGRHDGHRHRHRPRHSHERMDSRSSREEDEDDSESGRESDTTDYDDDKTSEKGTKSYPFIVSPPEKNKTSPASTVLPKPILKNKNTNHVRFDPEPHEVEPESPRSFRDDRDRREYSSSRRSRDRDDRDRDDHGRRRDEGRRRRDSDPYRGSERYRPRDDDYHRSSHGDRDRRDDRKEGRAMRRRAWGETLGAVGLGGAAASLLGVLAEAAVNSM